MHYLHIETCLVSPDGVASVKDKLQTLQNHYRTENVDKIGVTSIATEICSLLKTFTECEVYTSGSEYIRTIGTQGRYLLYIHDKQIIPSFMFMLTRPRVYINKHKCTKRYRGICTQTATNEMKILNHKDHSMRVFSCTGEFNCEMQRLNGGMAMLMESMGNEMTNNDHILKNIHAYTRQTHSSHSRFTSLTPVSNSDVALTVYVTEDDGSVTVLPVLSIGLQCARNALRNTGALYHTRLPSNTVNTECLHAIVIAQNHDYTLSMLLYAATFHLRLHKTEDLFNSTVCYTETASLVTMSHKFHSLDSVIEHSVTALPLNVPQSVPQSVPDHNKTKRHIINPTRVSGMLSVTHQLLRSNMVPATIRSMGSNCVTDMYAGMHSADVTRTLRAMCLVTDNRQIEKALNRLHRGVVVKLVSGIDLFCVEDGSNTDVCNVDFRIHRSGVLNYAIAHQNTCVTSILNRTIGFDMQEISTALYSGVSFCHACAYEEYPVHITHGFSVHLINASDFQENYTDAVHKLLETEAGVVSSVSHAVHWSRLRHNFHVQQSVSSVNQTPLGIECHATKSGLVFFRRVGQAMSPRGVDGFFGAVYVVPSLARACPVAPGGNVSSPPNPSQPIHKTVHPTPNPSHPVHKVVHLASQLAAQSPTSNVLFLRNATETLFHINSMCIHNAVNKHMPGDERISAFISPKQHAQLREVWLHTFMSRAYKLCGSSHKSEFYRIYAYLSNIASLPMDSAGYWRTVPYV